MHKYCVTTHVIGAPNSGRKSLINQLSNTNELLYTDEQYEFSTNFVVSADLNEIPLESFSVFLVYDITDLSSFEFATSQLQKLQKMTHFDSNLKFLVGTKRDISERRKVAYKQAVELNQEMNGVWQEIGANKLNIDNLSKLFKIKALNALRLLEDTGQHVRVTSTVKYQSYLQLISEHNVNAAKTTKSQQSNNTTPRIKIKPLTQEQIAYESPFQKQRSINTLRPQEQEINTSKKFGFEFQELEEESTEETFEEENELELSATLEKEHSQNEDTVEEVETAESDSKEFVQFSAKDKNYLNVINVEPHTETQNEIEVKKLFKDQFKVKQKTYVNNNEKMLNWQKQLRGEFYLPRDDYKQQYTKNRISNILNIEINKQKYKLYLRPGSPLQCARDFIKSNHLDNKYLPEVSERILDHIERRKIENKERVVKMKVILEDQKGQVKVDIFEGEGALEAAKRVQMEHGFEKEALVNIFRQLL
ncbi:Ras_domain-containing protein [Hexamita inflata]|uniref:small monomeric GTPase n=1 Tax=Hexamita inflata TaxID=28002 RepID=A0AA86N825_9EUKA|nr:Ras domain-containing protein [Hexamita inflata]